MSARMGRPPSDNPKTDRLFVRVTPEEKKTVQEFSRKFGVKVLDLIKIGMETLKKESQ